MDDESAFPSVERLLQATHVLLRAHVTERPEPEKLSVTPMAEMMRVSQNEYVEAWGVLLDFSRGPADTATLLRTAQAAMDAVIAADRERIRRVAGEVRERTA